MTALSMCWTAASNRNGRGSRWTARLIVGEDAELFGAKRNDKATWLYLNQDCDKIVGDAFLCADVGGDLIGFTKPVAKTICEEFGIDMEDDAWKD